jgi:hypothetical protein
MAQTRYQNSPPSGLRKASYGASPKRKIVQVSQGKISKPVPLPHGFGGNGRLLPAPKATPAAGYTGTI